MRNKTLVILLAAIVVTLANAPAKAGTWDGTIALGGIIIDEADGSDLSAVQETYNLYDGFSINRLYLTGNPVSDNYLMFDLKEINLDGRQGRLLYRKPGVFRLTANYDQHRQVFDPDRAVTSSRKDLHLGLRVTPSKWLRLSGYYDYLTRDGDRLSYPAGTGSVLGTSYDNTIKTGKLAAEVRKDRRVFGVDYRVTNYTDKLNGETDRKGQIVSARVATPDFFYDKVTHMLRGVYGVSDLSSTGLDYTLGGFEYTGVVKPWKVFAFKYNFDAQRVDNKSTQLKTDRFQNNFDATYYYPKGSLYAGYGYETNDDDRSLTSYNSWRVGGTFSDPRYNAKVRWASRTKKDMEKLTLLGNLEASRLLVDLGINPTKEMDIGFRFNMREREFPDVGVEAEGYSVGGTARYAYAPWGRVSGTYTYTNDDYTDFYAGYRIDNHVVTAWLDIEKIQNLVLSTGVTYYNAGKDMDIDKSILFFEGKYTVRNDIHFEVKYNVYNYDDYILRDRYYTANVIWLNVAYDLHVD